MRSSEGWRREVDRLLQIVGVGTFAVVQPVLDVMGRSPETFIFRGVGPGGIVVFALLVGVVPAVVLWGLTAATAILGPRVRRWAHLVVMGGLASVIAMQVLKRATPLADVALIAVAVAAGVAVAWLLTRLPGLATWARWAAVAAVASVLLFLFVAPVSKLLRTPEAGAAARRVAPIPVVMVIFDEFPLVSLLDRSEEINAALYPHLAELASTATWYRNYTVTEPSTRLSVPTILSGKRVEDRAAQPLAADHPDTLFTLLSESHRMEVFEPYTALCPAEVCGSGRGEGAGGLPGLVVDAASVWRDLSLPGGRDRDVTEQFDEPEDEGAIVPDPATAGLGDPGPFANLLRSLRPGTPTLSYLHSMLPHVPWKRFPDGREYDVTGAGANLAFAERDGRQLWVEDEWPVALARQRHLLQVQYVDRLIGRLIQRLRQEGLFDEALVVITADHGGSTTPGQPRRSPTPANAHEIYWVPLFIKAPGQTEGSVDDRNLTALDLLPTIADVLNTAVPWPTEGASAGDPRSDRGPVKTFTVFGDDGEVTGTITIDQQTAWRRMRRDAFAPEGPCRPELCPHLTGRAAPLISRTLDAFTIGPPWDGSATLTLPTDLRVDDDGPLPALVLGNLADEPASADTSVLVVMNGSVAGVSETWSRDGQAGWFGVLVPQWMLRAGENELQLFLVEGSTLTPVPIAG